MPPTNPSNEEHGAKRGLREDEEQGSDEPEEDEQPRHAETHDASGDHDVQEQHVDPQP